MVKRKGIADLTKRGYRLRVRRAVLRMRMRDDISRSIVATSVLAIDTPEVPNDVQSPQLNVTRTPDTTTNTHNTQTQHINEDDGDAQSEVSSILEEYTNKESLKDDLRHWAHDHVIPQSAVTALLGILRKNRIGGLPLDSRTLQQTPKTRNIVYVAPGSYCHIGLLKALDVYMRNSAVPPTELTLDFNIDGLPLYESSQKGVWLILVSVTAANCSRHIYVVGVYLGDTKPESFSEFLRPFIEEAKELANYSFGGKPVVAKIRCIICDAPARNSCLGTKSYAGYYGCGRCCQKGRHTASHGMIYPESFAEKRTDESFRSRAQPDHHNYDSPFLELDVDMVRQFPLDYLHTVLLGVVKKFLHTIVNGVSRTSKLGKLSPRDIQWIGDRLDRVSSTQPSEFQRKCRPLKRLSDFKGTEFRSLILYILPVVTRGILPPEQYQNMLLLHVALQILVDPNLCKLHADLAQSLLEHFVQTFGAVYGEDNIVYNVHSLVHIVDDVKLYGNLDNYSAFPFESYMFKVKRMVLKHNQELQQICNRVEESYHMNAPTQVNPSKVMFKKETNVNSNRVFKEVVFADFKLNSAPRNQWFYTDNFEIYKFEYCNADQSTMCARKVVQQVEFYENPISSVKLNIFKSNGVVSNLVTISLSSVKCKAFAMPLNTDLIFAPLRHSL